MHRHHRILQIYNLTIKNYWNLVSFPISFPQKEAGSPIQLLTRIKLHANGAQHYLAYSNFNFFFNNYHLCLEIKHFDD